MALRTVLLLAVGVLLLALAQGARAQTSQEEVKATFIYRFASFVVWPRSVFADASSPVRLCVVGADPLAQTLQRQTAGQRAGARAFEVRRIAAPSDIAGCQVVYVVGERTEATLRAARHTPILTITDSIGGGERGIIHFALVDSRVRFYIDDAGAAESGLAVDPRLLSVALAVRRRQAS